MTPPQAGLAPVKKLLGAFFILLMVLRSGMAVYPKISPWRISFSVIGAAQQYVRGIPFLAFVAWSKVVCWKPAKSLVHVLGNIIPVIQLKPMCSFLAYLSLVYDYLSRRLFPYNGFASREKTLGIVRHRVRVGPNLL